MDFLDKRVGVICNELKKLKSKADISTDTVGIQGRKLCPPGGCTK